MPGCDAEEAAEAAAHGKFHATLTAGCKINLYLYITGIRANGYHEIDSLFLPLAKPCDLVHIRPGKASGLSFSSDAPWLDPHNNTLTKAYNAFAEYTGFAPAMEIALEKGIPSGAGLGGGSSDAAALLLYLNKASKAPISLESLAEVALKIGADVPFFLYNRPSLVRGIGEKITPCSPALAGLTLVLVCPDIHVSTPLAYRLYDESVARLHGSRQCSAQEASKVMAEKENYASNLPTWGLTSSQSQYKKLGLRLLHIINELEQVVFATHPSLGSIKANLLKHGAAAALMSGSGSSVFGLFRDASQAKTATAEMLRNGLKVYSSVLQF